MVLSFCAPKSPDITSERKKTSWAIKLIFTNNNNMFAFIDAIFKETCSSLVYRKQSWQIRPMIATNENLMEAGLMN